ncbi:FtsW/RodA/SpoVE family cell cycle protein [Candidatus Haliotispira prima]|uniref:Probable peptidoglycan glycosyltransferase FtsW n=1 Tax=Candidatus Haliotispira prima TaxID=3034016 RepID=A0ABY8MGR5_9SPIO|nr:FtsW/RodA/SpoVE family cell cycle protein [Candidatus Haliotispira prima]
MQVDRRESGRELKGRTGKGPELQEAQRYRPSGRPAVGSVSNSAPAPEPDGRPDGVGLRGAQGAQGVRGAHSPRPDLPGRGLWYSLQLVWYELAEEFRADQSYSPFLLLLTLEVLLILSGATFLYSNSTNYMLQRHLMWLSLGFFVSLVMYLVPIRTIVQCIPYFAVLALVLNAMPHIPGLQLANDGSPRWIRLWGLSFQVSETLRLMLVLYFARRISMDLLKHQKWLQEDSGIDRQNFIDYYPKVLWYPLLYLLLTTLLVILQKDYSTTVLLLIVASAMVVLVGSWATLGLTLLVLSFVTVVAMLFLGQTFRINRVNEWIEGSGEQINWVYDALREGSLFGIGLGQGRAKHLIPAEMTDFPLAAVGEEAGFVGIIFVFCLFLLFAIVGFSLARRNRIVFVRYATAGLTGLIFIQALVNFSVSCGILPVTGQPLPFFSVGGSSTLTYMVTLGLINSFNRPSRNLRSGNTLPTGGMSRDNVSAGHRKQQRGRHLYRASVRSPRLQKTAPMATAPKSSENYHRYRVPGAGGEV